VDRLIPSTVNLFVEEVSQKARIALLRKDVLQIKRLLGLS